MFQTGLLDGILYRIKKLIPKSVFNFFAPAYHAGLAYLGALLYGFPSRSLKVIGVTGTKGKSTTVFLISKILENVLRDVQGKPVGVAAIGSLGFKIKEREWPNTLKMTMPGRLKLQKFLYEAKKAGCEFVVLEVTSEGIKQKRHLGIKFDCAVFTNIHKEHIESHGSFENYQKTKEELFRLTPNMHIINADDQLVGDFGKYSSKKKMFFGLKSGDIRAENIKSDDDGVMFEVYGTHFTTHLAGDFNVYNCLAALAVAAMYGIDLPSAKPVLENIKSISGRMEFIQRSPFNVVIDYAHTPDSLEAVYQSLSGQTRNSSDDNNVGANTHVNKLICVFGAAGGGRDKWKRPEFGEIAEKYCDEIILTNEDPYDENPEKIIEDIFSGFSSGLKLSSSKVHKVMERREAIKKALADAQEGDTVIITGKGSEISMALAGGKKIPWSDKKITVELLQKSRTEVRG